MKRIGMIALVLAALALSATPAMAQHHYHGGPRYGFGFSIGGYAPYYPYYAARPYYPPPVYYPPPAYYPPPPAYGYPYPTPYPVPVAPPPVPVAPAPSASFFFGR